ncbi:ABC transporter permease [Hymenobacter norwichensis]|uniref:ABC transporter permease n=1 Tax=Hymenobacter norwichensis TaxID=223903 RepID=UPI0003B42802|nr:ABC transporter permease subunit [Hymenobacter norwichensis]
MRPPPQQTTSFGWQQWLAVTWLGLLLLAAVGAGLLPEQYLAPDLLHTSAPPLTPNHGLGTDPLGQDVGMVLLFGARVALCVSLPAALLAAALGTLLGLLAGYWGNQRLQLPACYWLSGFLAAACYVLVTVPSHGLVVWWWPLALGAVAILVGRFLSCITGLRKPIAFPADWLLLTLITLLAALPRLLLVLTVAAASEPTFWGLVVLLTLTTWPQSARLVRAEVQRVRQLPYLEAATAAGLPPWRIVRHHLLPNVWGPIATTIPLSMAALIALETTLSFLGVGLPPEIPSWGRLLAFSRVAPDAWWLLALPGLCLLATTLSLRQLLPVNKQRSTI